MPTFASREVNSSQSRGIWRGLKSTKPIEASSSVTLTPASPLCENCENIRQQSPSYWSESMKSSGGNRALLKSASFQGI
jgi:hypothetical protein